MKKLGLAAVLAKPAAKPAVQDEYDDEGPSSDAVACAAEFQKALKSGDAATIATAMHNFIRECS